MRALTLTLAIALPFGLAACNAEPEQPEVIEDIQEDAEGPIEEEVQQELGIQTDAYGGYDTDGDMLLSESEYDAGIGDGAFATYDTDGDGFLSEEEYGVYESSLEM
jgi:hypothetical protein